MLQMGKLGEDKDSRDPVFDKPISDSMVSGIRRLWQNEALVDFTLEVEDRTFRVHKVGHNLIVTSYYQLPHVCLLK